MDKPGDGATLANGCRASPVRPTHLRVRITRLACSRSRRPLMRVSLILLVSLAAVASLSAPAHAQVAVELSGEIDGRGLVLAESEKPVHRIQLTAKVDKDGVGGGTLVLDPTAPAVDEFGLPQTPAPQPPVKLECVLKFVKKKTI